MNVRKQVSEEYHVAHDENEENEDERGSELVAHNQTAGSSTGKPEYLAVFLSLRTILSHSASTKITPIKPYKHENCTYRSTRLSQKMSFLPGILTTH